MDVDPLIARLKEISGAVASLRNDMAILTAEVSRNHNLLLEVEGRVRRTLETNLSFVERSRAVALGEALRPRRAAGRRKVRVGSQNDGGYVVLDDLDGLAGLVSGGAGDNVDFELELSRRGLSVQVYDHTVEALPIRGGESFLEFFKEPLGSDGTSLQDALSRAPDGDLLLKVDIDGGEWALLAGARGDLDRFRQIVLELHGLLQVGDSLWFERAFGVIEAIARTHFPVHVHANNFGAYSIVGGVPLPDILEVTFARRSSYEFQLSEPSPEEDLDQPNDPGRPEYALGFLCEEVPPA